MLKHKNLRNIDVATSFGKIHFNEEGFSDDLTEDEQKELGKLHNFEYLSEDDVEQEEEVRDEEVVQEEVQEEEVVEEEVVEEEVVEEEVVEEEVEIKEYSDITTNQIKEELDNAEVEYSTSANKKELYKLYTEEFSK